VKRQGRLTALKLRAERQALEAERADLVFEIGP
jgi:hypothetical protein